jgi:hypothetical protein
MVEGVCRAGMVEWDVQRLHSINWMNGANATSDSVLRVKS